MSEDSTLVTARHFDYVAARTRPEDDFLATLKKAAAAAGIPPIWVAPEQANLMQILLKLHRAKDVVEVGTLAGYSAIAMARALPGGGRVRTIELDPKHAAFAREWVAKSDVADRIEVLEGAGSDVLATLADDSADACFLDADKVSYADYLERCRRIVRPGGLYMVDNAFAFGQLFDEAPTDPEAPAVMAFNDHLAELTRASGDPRKTGSAGGIHAVIVPIGDGLWVGVGE